MEGRKGGGAEGGKRGGLTGRREVPGLAQIHKRLTPARARPLG